MKIEFTKQFDKQYEKLPIKVQLKLKDRIRLFQKNPRARQLRAHKLTGKYLHYYSIDITGDIRAIYKIQNNTIYFTKLGTHSELY